MAHFDVLIAGTGPAGSALVISLADFAPDVTTCVVDDGAHDRDPVGETVPPQIRPVLAHLALWPQFLNDGHEASYRTCSAWGSAQLASNEFLFQTQQIGWRLDRRHFDLMMRHAAMRRTTASLTGKITEIAFLDSVWHVCLDDGTTHTSRAIADATGRAAALARLQGLRSRRLDRLVGSFVIFEDASTSDRDLMIEAVEDGWWYTAALPAGRRIAAFMTDADLARHRRVRDLEHWQLALQSTEHVAAATAWAQPVSVVQMCGAGSQIMTGDAPGPLLCVGDAASSFDPISGLGIVKAMRSAIFASYAIADWIERGDDRPLQRYRDFVNTEYRGYRRTLKEYYGAEQRWPGSVFWRRRNGTAASASERVSDSLE